MLLLFVLAAAVSALTPWCQFNCAEEGDNIDIGDFLVSYTDAKIGLLRIRALAPAQDGEGTDLINSTNFLYDIRGEWPGSTMISFAGTAPDEPKSTFLTYILEGLNSISNGNWFQPDMVWTFAARGVYYIQEKAMYCAGCVGAECAPNHITGTIYASFTLMYVPPDHTAAFSLVNFSIPLIPDCEIEYDSPLGYVFNWNRQILLGDSISAPTANPIVDHIFEQSPGFYSAPNLFTLNMSLSTATTGACTLNPSEPLTYSLTPYLDRTYYYFQTSADTIRYLAANVCPGNGDLVPTTLAKAGGLVTLASHSVSNVVAAIRTVYPAITAAQTIMHINTTDVGTVYSQNFTVHLQYITDVPVYKKEVKIVSLTFTQYNGTAYAMGAALTADAADALPDIWSNVNCQASAPLVDGCNAGDAISADYVLPITTGVSAGTQCRGVVYKNCTQTAIGYFNATFTPVSIVAGIVAFDPVRQKYGVAHVMFVLLSEYNTTHGLSATVATQHLVNSTSKQLVLNTTAYTLERINATTFGVYAIEALDELPASATDAWTDVDCVPTKIYDATCNSDDINKLGRYNVFYVLSSVVGVAEGDACMDPVYSPCFIYEPIPIREYVSVGAMAFLTLTSAAALIYNMVLRCVRGVGSKI